jgi:hypothetical protein
MRTHFNWPHWIFQARIDNGGCYLGRSEGFGLLKGVKEMIDGLKKPESPIQISKDYLS